jgi:hypothetical protein
MIGVLSARGNNTMLRVNGLIEYIPNDRTTINAVYNNTYVNPPTSVPARLSIQRTYNLGNPISMQNSTGYLSLYPAISSAVSINNNNNGIVLTQGSVISDTTSFSVTRTMKVNVNAFYNRYSGITYNAIPFALLNTTDNIRELWSVSSTTGGVTAQTLINNIIGVCTL